jgi:hypothetical protein
MKFVRFYYLEKRSVESQSYASCWLPFVRKQQDSTDSSNEEKKFLYTESPRMKEKLNCLLPSFARCFPFCKLESPGLVRWVVLVSGWVWDGKVVKVCECGGVRGFSDLAGTTTCCRAAEWGQLGAVAGFNTTNVCTSALHNQESAPLMCSTTLPNLTAIYIFKIISANCNKHSVPIKQRFCFTKLKLSVKSGIDSSCLYS